MNFWKLFCDAGTSYIYPQKMKKRWSANESGLNVPGLKKKPLTSILVHCECRLICHYIQEIREGKERPYSYVGVSKLSCRACYLFISSVNQVMDCNWLTKGCHHKFYYPWKFPNLSRGGNTVATVMYDKVAVLFGRSYPGFRVKVIIPLSDSDPPGTSADEVVFSSDDDLHEYRRRQRERKGKKAA